MDRNETATNTEKGKGSKAEKWNLQTHVKIGFTGEWNNANLIIEGNTLMIQSQQGSMLHGPLEETLNIKKIKSSEIIKDSEKIRIHNPPKKSLPILFIEYVDKSLYFIPKGGLSYCTLIKKSLEVLLISDQNTLLDQQLTIDDIPVIVDKCLKFITTEGALTQGIYRIAGVNSQIRILLEEFRQNAWAVKLDPSQNSVHDVADLLKRFVRTLDHPLLTKNLRYQWIENSSIEDIDDKLVEYRKLLSQLPVINYKTLRRLIVHLRAISEQNEHNLMPVSNLAALWGPTILTVESTPGINLADTRAEVQVVTDLTEHFYDLFDVDEVEVKKEKNRIKVSKGLGVADCLTCSDPLGTLSGENPGQTCYVQLVRGRISGDIKVLKTNILLSGIFTIWGL